MTGKSIQLLFSRMPMSLVVFDTGEVAFCPLSNMPEMIELGMQATASFHKEAVVVTSGLTVEEFSYNTAYRVEDHPGLKTWIKQQYWDFLKTFGM